MITTSNQILKMALIQRHCRYRVYELPITADHTVDNDALYHTFNERVADKPRQIKDLVPQIQFIFIYFIHIIFI